MHVRNNETESKVQSILLNISEDLLAQVDKVVKRRIAKRKTTSPPKLTAEQSQTLQQIAQEKGTTAANKHLRGLHAGANRISRTAVLIGFIEDGVKAERVKK